LIILKKPIKDFEEYEKVLNRLEELEDEGKDAIREFRNLKIFLKKFENKYILESESPD
jgi:hypothetical protein